jgi:hypothetical protein
MKSLYFPRDAGLSRNRYVKWRFSVRYQNVRVTVKVPYARPTQVATLRRTILVGQRQEYFIALSFLSPI